MISDSDRLLKEKYLGMKTPDFFVDCERLKSGEPLAYVIGWIPFLDTKIYLDQHPLIPRPETEFWVQHAINSIRGGHMSLFPAKRLHSDIQPHRILDLCAGSGAIGVAFGNAFPKARVDFCEIDPRLHATITKNICENGIDYTHTRIFGGDLFSEIPRGTTYDMILANPPYIDPLLGRVEESVTTFEPHRALYGGVGGMELIARIIADAPAYLKPEGALVIEHEPEQSKAIHARSREALFTHATTYKDQYGIERYSILTR
jgi:release factor glutamine methyltransferase